jgi:hypothetical protein
MRQPTILAGGPVREAKGELFDTWSKCIHAQERVEIDLSYEVDKGYTPGDIHDTHIWRHDAIERVAYSRQSFLDRFVESEYDKLLFVDDDLLLSVDTAATLVQQMQLHNADIAYGVFWTVWQNGSPPLPQVWDEHPYGFRDPELMVRLNNRETMVVRGGGACTMLSKRAAELCRYHPRITSLPMGQMWQGEDRTFALCAEVHGLKQIAVSSPRIIHLYSPAMRTHDMIRLGLRMAGYRED